MAEPLTLTNRDLLALHRGLNSLDGVRRGDGVEGFEFDDETRWALVENAVIVGRAKEAFDRYDREAAKRFGVFEGMAKSEANGQKLAEYLEDIEQAKDRTVGVPGLTPIAREKLLTGPADGKRPPRKNAIPVSVLVALRPILEDPANG